MSRNRMNWVAGLVVATALSACASVPDTPHGHSAVFGEAVRHNVAMHMVAPTDAQKDNTFIPADADRMKAAVKKYKEDEVEEPVSIDTTR